MNVKKKKKVTARKKIGNIKSKLVKIKLVSQLRMNKTFKITFYIYYSQF